MPSFSKTVLLLSALSQFAIVLAAPVPQLAGEGSACNSVLSSTDNGVGYGVENAEDNTASLVSGSKTRRQLAGEGSACDSVLSSTDNGVGYGVENAEDNTAAAISGTSTTSTSSGSGQAPPPPPPKKKAPKAKRQADKIANGAATVLNAAHLPTVANPVKTYGDSIDGELTSGAANLGAKIGNTEASTLEGAGKSVPKIKRQADKIANGAAEVIKATGQDQLAGIEKTDGDTVDGQLTSDAATIGAQVGNYEGSTLENTGKSVPRM